MTATAPTAEHHHDPAEPEYEGLLDSIRNRLVSVMGPLFTTDLDSEALWTAFLYALPVERRQHYTCHACKGFVTRYGGLVTIDGDGRAEPLCWVPGTVGGIMEPAVAALHRLVRKAHVNGVFVTSTRTLGQPVTGDWHHMAGTLPAAVVYTGRVLTAGQRAAELREDYGTLCRGLHEFQPETLRAAVTLLEGDDLYRGNKTLGVGRWLLDLRERRDALRGPARDNVTWLAVATAPAGWCHVKSTMIGTLLEDIETGKDFAAVSRSFAAKMHPLLYQRPQALPRSGTVAQAEELVATLGVTASLQRRFARLDEVVAIWRPRVPEAPAAAGGVFGNVPTRDRPTGGVLPALQGIAAKVITWERFEADVLPGAERIEVHLHGGMMPFYALTTAADAGAPPILQWDREDRRNPVGWYTIVDGSMPSQWSLRQGWLEVAAVSLFPPQWHDRDAFGHQGQGALLLLPGAIPTSSGAGMFPEFLRSEFHGIRAVIEQHQHRSVPVDDQPAAVGLGIRAEGRGGSLTVRVTAAGVVREYTIDRWR